MYRCLDCGRKFRTIEAAETAADEGCPKCDSTNIDLDNRQTGSASGIDHETIDVWHEANTRTAR